IIVAPIEGTPAERAGIKPGDVILSVDGESTEGWTQEKAVLKIRGPRGSKVSLQVKHADGTEETLDIERDEIKVQSVTTVPPGGLLDTTVAVADEFLDSGTILSEQDRGGQQGPTTSAKKGGLATQIPVVVILNRFSASGSEVLSAALHDNNRATIVARLLSWR